MDGDEELREALLELEQLRRREAERSRESNAIIAALEVMSSSSDATEGIDALLASICQSIGAKLVALAEAEAEADRLIFRNPDRSDLGGLSWHAPGLLSRERCIIDVRTVTGLWSSPPAQLERWRSLLSAPLGDSEHRMVMMAFSDRRAAFNAQHGRLLNRLATIASQVILRRKLEERNAFLAAVIDESPVSVTVSEAGGDAKLIYSNDAFSALTGFAREEVIGENCRFLTAEAADSQVRRDIRRTVSERSSGTFLLRNRRKSGEDFWNELQLFPIRDAEGAATHLVATQTDATARVQAEAERDHARRQLEGALSATSEGFMILGSTARVRYVNAVFRDMFGADLFPVGEQLAPAVFGMLVNSTDITGIEACIQALGKPINREMRAPNGCHLLLRARPMQEGGMVVAATDITQTKVNEKILRQRLAAIEKSQDGIAIGDPEGRILHANPSLVRLWGQSSEAECLGRRWTTFYATSLEDRFRADGYEDKGAWRGEARCQAGTAQATHEISLSRVPEVGTVLVVSDVTARREQEAERNRLRLQLDRAQVQDQLGQISMGLAHDLNNLLSGIKGSAGLIEGASGLSDASRKAVARITTATDRAVELVDGFLDLGLRERRAEPLDLGDMVRTTVDLARGGAPAAAGIGLHLPDAPVRVAASKTDVLQAVMNLVVNGIDALEGQPGTVRVSLAEPRPFERTDRLALGLPQSGASYAAIMVEDTGSGMSQATAERMLKPYFTTKHNKGSGLGMSIVRSILSANGCLLTLDTSPGAGTRMTIYWPTDTEAMRTQPTETAPPGKSRLGLPILILDDQAEVAATIAADLTSAGYEVAETTDPAMAIAAVAEDPAAWGCLVTDYDMPELTGGDVVSRIRDIEPQFPIIVVSALARRIDDPRVRTAVSVLPKPVDAARLLAAVRTALKRE